MDYKFLHIIKQFLFSYALSIWYMLYAKQMTGNFEIEISMCQISHLWLNPLSYFTFEIILTGGN